MYVWEFREGEEAPIKTKVGSHNDWVRDVAWCANIGLAHEMIASCSEDGTCIVWVSESDPQNKKQAKKWV